MEQPVYESCPIKSLVQRETRLLLFLLVQVRQLDVNHNIYVEHFQDLKLCGELPFSELKRQGKLKGQRREKQQ